MGQGHSLAQRGSAAAMVQRLVAAELWVAEPPEHPTVLPGSGRTSALSRGAGPSHVTVHLRSATLLFIRSYLHRTQLRIQVTLSSLSLPTGGPWAGGRSAARVPHRGGQSTGYFTVTVEAP